jgi:hypothetical protein
VARFLPKTVETLIRFPLNLFAWGFTTLTQDEMWGAQYIPTTTTAVSVGPVANLPRLNYPINSDGSVGCPSLLLEPQRTNLFNFSEQFDNAYWDKNGIAASSNVITSPDGYTNADKLGEDTTTGQHYLNKSSFAVSATSTYTISIYAKKSERDVLVIRAFTPTFAVLGQGTFNLTNATATGTGASIVSVGNDWYRCILTYTTGADTTNNYRINLVTDGNYAGINGYGLYAYGAQIELGSYPTSYIPTLGATVTRGADACSKTGISSLIGQTEGTLFVDAQIGSNTEFTTMSISDGSTNNRVTIAIDAQSAVRSIVVTSGTVQTQLSASLTGTRVKAAITYTASGFKLFYNGALINSSTKAVFGSTLSRYGFDQANGGNALFRSVNQTLLFPTALSDAEAIALTTL